MRGAFGVGVLIGRQDCGDEGIVGLEEGDAADERILWKAVGEDCEEEGGEKEETTLLFGGGFFTARKN